MVNNTAIGAVLSLPHDDMQRRQTLLHARTRYQQHNAETREHQAVNPHYPLTRRSLQDLFQGFRPIYHTSLPDESDYEPLVLRHQFGILLRSTTLVWVALLPSLRKGTSPFYFEPDISRPGIPQTTWYSIRGCHSPNHFRNSFFLGLNTPLEWSRYALT